MIAVLLLLAAHVMPGRAEAIAVLLEYMQCLPAAEALQLDKLHARMLRRLTCRCRLGKLLRPS